MIQQNYFRKYLKMSVFAGAKKKVTKKDTNQFQDDNPLSARVAAVKAVLEHIGLYIGLACYTALGAKARILKIKT